MQGLEAVASHLVSWRDWDFWKGFAESSMDQSSQHGLHSTVRYCIEFLLVSVHSSCIVICSVDKSDMFGKIVVCHETGFANRNVVQLS
jgi:hypothetical protein